MQKTNFSNGRNVHAAKVLKRLHRKYEYLGSGLYRVAYKVGKHVLKFPLNEDGEFCNDGEAYYRDKTYARGRYVVIDGFVCVMQEQLFHIPFPEIRELAKTDEYDWINWVDGFQVGRDAQGNVKAYDFVHP